MQEKLNSEMKSLTGSAAAPSNHSVENICVYCGSGVGTDPAYTEAARTLGSDLAAAGIGLVYGGGGLGLMGEVATSTIAHGGRVTGIIPRFLTGREHMLQSADELVVTENMHQRKQLMFDRADAFVALPGGVGTLEELVEQLTWSQLGQHEKPIIVANVNGFWTPFLDLLSHMQAQAFIRDGLEVKFIVVDRADEIVPAAIEACARAKEGASEESVLAKF